MPLGTGVYGTNASNAVTYGQATVSVGQSIAAATWNSIATTINAERGRRGYGAVLGGVTNPIQAATFNAFKTALEVPGPAASQAYNVSGTVTVVTYPQAPVPTGATAVSIGQQITAAGLNALITELNNAGAVCTCNCNYCTCNCNYCTCNCNYACTCNCNYSDERLKDNVKFIGVKAGVNVYSFTYLADKETTYVGAMAQDLLKSKYASAVSLDDNGYYTVDYGKLPIKFKIKK
jgi:hypothetical protein